MSMTGPPGAGPAAPVVLPKPVVPVNACPVPAVVLPKPAVAASGTAPGMVPTKGPTTRSPEIRRGGDEQRRNGGETTVRGRGRSGSQCDIRRVYSSSSRTTGSPPSSTLPTSRSSISEHSSTSSATEQKSSSKSSSYSSAEDMASEISSRGASPASGSSSEEREALSSASNESSAAGSWACKGQASFGFGVGSSTAVLSVEEFAGLAGGETGAASPGSAGASALCGEGSNSCCLRRWAVAWPCAAFLAAAALSSSPLRSAASRFLRWAASLSVSCFAPPPLPPGRAGRGRAGRSPPVAAGSLRRPFVAPGPPPPQALPPAPMVLVAGLLRPAPLSVVPACRMVLAMPSRCVTLHRVRILVYSFIKLWT
mmetsp:Transcript_93691/g.291689  ORF Transcript_93691/g.291689 Transcript_93691/m.291689 type:complete len:368 (-) Transcript_93691:790-1893(-)